MIYSRFQCESKAKFETWGFKLGFLVNIRAADGSAVVWPADGLNYVEIGPIRQNVSDNDPEVIDPLFHVDFRVWGPPFLDQWSAFLASAKGKQFIAAHMEGNKKQADTWKDTPQGISLVEPLTPRHVWA